MSAHSDTKTVDGPTSLSPASPIGFSGSYDPSDVTFLLEQISLETTDVAEKERMIQTGQRHYSEMITREKPPSMDYLSLFARAHKDGRERLGREVASLALAIDQQVQGPITLASLVRAGVPLGVLLTRALRKLGRDVAHFGISIIRDRGLDENALKHILTERPIDGLLFVDGWTGKGAIATELEKDFGRLYGRDPRLVVLADPCGRAGLSASGDDWLIPSGILGSTISGLISRSILNDDTIALGGFHGCVYWDHLKMYDLSATYLEEAWLDTACRLNERTKPATWSEANRVFQRLRSQTAVQWVVDTFGITNLNRVKPGIAEATRAILRRAPERVFINSETDPDLSALIFLANQANVPVEVVEVDITPYRAITLIAKAA